MPATYEPIASMTVSAASDATFSSIPGTFTDLVLTYSLTHSTGTQDLYIQFNSDTSANFSNTTLSGTGSTAVSVRISSNPFIVVDSYAYPGTSERAINTIQIMSYSNTNVFKTVLAAAARAGSGVDRVVGLWRSTSAITSIRVYAPSGTITGDLALYGIKAA